MNVDNSLSFEEFQSKNSKEEGFFKDDIEAIKQLHEINNEDSIN